MENIKQVIVVRKDLNMRKGKLASQVAHASLGTILGEMSSTRYEGDRILTLKIPSDSPIDLWLEDKFTKVVVGVNSENELLCLYNEIKETDMPCCLIEDSGKTEFKGIPTLTALAIGPWWSDEIDCITGDLKLL